MRSNLLEEATQHRFLLLAIESKVVGKGGVLEDEGDEQFADVGGEVPIFLLLLVLEIMFGSLY